MFLENLLFPKHCLSCGRIGIVVCENCKKKLFKTRHQSCIYCFKPSLLGLTHFGCKRERLGVDQFVSVYKYKGVVRKIIKKAKYRFAKKDFMFFLEHVKDDLNPVLEQSAKIWGVHSFLCPIPLHPTRKRWRGFNQSVLISQYASRRLNLPIKEVLVRVKNTKPQSFFKNKIKRRNNMRQAFRLINQSVVARKTIVLVDDVVTTGSTVYEAARVLKRHGAQKVFVFALSRAF